MDSTKSVLCPNCHKSHVPVGGPLQAGVYSVRCLHCEQNFKFRSIDDARHQVSIQLNGQIYNIGSEVSQHVTLNDYIRDVAGLKGTKFMCREAGCGCCVVAANFPDPSAPSQTKTVSVNSCIIPVLACDGWSVTTTEGLGNSKTGFDPIQTIVAKYYGSQCGFCTPGMVMNMAALLADNPKPAKSTVESSFDGNLCRCTGYRPILAAMKSLVCVDEDKTNGHSEVLDIEDLTRYGAVCQGKSGVVKDCAAQQLAVKLADAVWLKPASKDELLSLVDQYKQKRIRFVVGNTSTGIYKRDGPFDVYIDTKGVTDLYEMGMTDDAVVLGANISLADMIKFFQSCAQKSSGFQYLSAFAVHLAKVANVPARNIGSWAGNLMIKHAHPEFPSDLFTLMSSVGAVLSISSKTSGDKDISIDDFLSSDITAHVILKVTFAAKAGCNLYSYKIMPRVQNAHAYVNAACLIKLDDKQVVQDQPRLAFGGISKGFVRASKTESFLVKMSLLDENVVQGALACLESEIIPDSDPGLSSVAYRKSLSLSLLYRCILEIVGDSLPDRLKSGQLPLTRGLSTGKHDYDTDKTQWPVTEPMPKLTATLQASGEAQYCQDIPKIQGQLYAAFVLASQACATISVVDVSEALSLPGVVKYLDARNIPQGGVNSVWPPQLPPVAGFVEPLFATKSVDYAGQAVGLIVAETQQLANYAAERVKISYSDVKKPVLDLKEAVEKKRFFDGLSQEFKVGDAESAIAKADKVITGEISLGTQYHFTMETQSCLCVPKEQLLEVYPTSQWIDGSQSVIAQLLGISNSRVRAEVRRLGGGYGGKLTRNFPVNAACALAAYVLDKPVSMVMSLDANMQVMGKRFPWYAQYQVGVSNTGMLNGLKVTYYNDSGYAPTESTYNQIYPFIDNAYHCDNWHLNAVAVKTDTPQNTSARSPATLPAIFIMENIMEHVASELKVDPTSLRRQNLYKINQVTPMGQKLEFFNLDKIMDELQASADVTSRLAAIEVFNQQNRWKKRGLSVVPVKYALLWMGGNFNVLVSVYGRDGSVAIEHGGIEMGQGLNTKTVQVCAHELGIDLALITVRPTSDLAGANSGMSGGSVTSELCCLGVQRACAILSERIAPVRAKMPAGSTWPDVIRQCYNDNVDLAAHYWLSGTTEQGDRTPAEYYCYGAMCAEVELDVLTGEHVIPRVDVLYDCGQSTNPEVDMGQIEGAVTMAIGYYLHEQIRYDPTTGRNLSASTWEYKIPSSADIPVDMRISFLKNSPNPVKVIRSKAVAEPPMSITCSVLFALRHAIAAARRETGSGSEYVSAGPPTTVEYAQQLCLPARSQLVIH